MMFNHITLFSLDKQTRIIEEIIQIYKNSNEESVLLTDKNQGYLTFLLKYKIVKFYQK